MAEIIAPAVSSVSSVTVAFAEDLTVGPESLLFADIESPAASPSSTPYLFCCPRARTIRRAAGDGNYRER
jgi:hypothetical protein